MSVKYNSTTVALLFIFFAWGIYNLISAAGVSFTVNGADQYVIVRYLNVLYVSVFIASVVAFVSCRLGGLIALLAAVTAVIMLYRHASLHTFPTTLAMALTDIALHPLAASLFLFCLSLYKSRLPPRPLWKAKTG